MLKESKPWNVEEVVGLGFDNVINALHTVMKSDDSFDRPKSSSPRDMIR